ncbi:MAG TPA: hypothetical protein VIJ25_05235, partial [Methylococcales bacterium]
KTYSKETVMLQKPDFGRLGKWLPVIVLMAMMVVSGCNTYRLLPSHGGGKRFNEEERVVSSAIRNAVAQMVVKDLAGHKVNVNVVTVSQNGGSSLTFPGLSSVSAGYNDNSLKYAAPNVLSGQDNWSASASYAPNLAASPTVFGSDQDLTYLDAAIQMKLRLLGAMVNEPNSEYNLYVLVDVLGTNRSKQDSFVVWNDLLNASCELTYYAIDRKTGKIAIRAKRASAESLYRESSIFGLASYKIDRYQYKTTPTPMPTDTNDSELIMEHESMNYNPVEYAADKVSSDKNSLANKLLMANSYIQAGNLSAAEKLVLEIQTVNPDYPGLDAVRSRLQNAKVNSAPAR